MNNFKLIEIKDNKFRIGQIKEKRTPRFFMINGFGGGGTNVSRFLIYLPLFKKSNSELLLNYYYLNTKFKKTPAFNTKLLEKLQNFDDIRTFIEYARKQMIQYEQSCISSIKYSAADWNPLVLLDSGSGNIFRDLAGHLDETNFERILSKETHEYIDFCEKLKFDLAISLDIAGKYTKKKGEASDKNYINKLEKFSEPRWNLDLSELFLKSIPEASNVSYYIPIHGNSAAEYLDCLNTVFTMENNVKKKFDGIAIGGLGSIKSHDIICDIVRLIRSRMSNLDDNRPIHVLGVGSLPNIIPLSYYGADTFDCNSPWRRASEDKLVLPLLTSDFEVVAKDDSFWDYVPISKISHLDCDCEVCQKYSVSDLKNLKKGSSEESIYFRILAYKHNIHQQEVLCKLIRSKTSVFSILNEMPKSKNKDKIKKLLQSI